MIQVTVGDCQWLVTRRYRQFDELHELVRKVHRVTAAAGPVHVHALCIVI